MKKSLLALLLALLAVFGFATLTEYTFEQSAATYTELTNPTVIHSTGIDDAMSGVINIGFDFLYDEVVYSTFKANTNGFITLNPSSTASLSNSLTTQILILAGLWDDLKTDDSNSHVAYQLTGTSPSQVLTVEYKNIKWYYSASPVNLVNFQIKLYQGTNRVEIIYGTMGASPGTSASASIGCSGAVAGNFLSVTPASPTASVSSTTEFGQINGTHVPFLTGNKYSFIPPVPLNNDLTATGISGNITPSVNNPTVYTVTVYNRGLNAQATYQVQLINASNTVLASVAGPAISAGATAQVQVTWTPTLEGPVALRGKVALAGDENTANDVTGVLNITVMPAGIIVATIGDGSQTMRMPLDFFYKNSLNETLYYPTEIGVFGNITAITLYTQFTQDLLNMPVKIWMGSTDLNDLSAAWIPSTSLIQVYDGTVNFPTGDNIILIPLQVPFAYTGGNLVVMFNRPMDTQYYNSTDYFKGQTVGTNRARNVYSDSTTYDPASPGAVGTVSGQFAKTSLYMSPLSPDPLFAINPSNKDFGSVLMNTTHDQTFTVVNAGGGTLVVNNISIAGSPFFSLQNLPTLPVSLTTGQTTTFVGRYNPTAAGTHSANITITDNRGYRLTHTVVLTGTSMDVTIYTLPYSQNFDGVTAPALPLDWSGLFNPTGTAAVVVTYASSPHSAPNCVRMYNGSTAGTEVYLIAPPVAPANPLNTVRMKFWVKAGGSNYTMNLGVMSDPLNPASYTQVSTISPTTAWAEYVVPFNGYTGTGTYIAIKHDTGGTGRTFYIDDVIIELIAGDDLACTALTGNVTPSVGNATTYTASVFNWGFNAQSNYTVKLFNASNVELATAPGVASAPGSTVQVPLVWTPSLEGPATLYAKVFLTGDQNPTNDQSPNLNVTVMPAGMFVVTVGDGSQTMRIPLDFFYHNSLNETLYFPNELGMFGNISAISLYNQFVTTTLTNMPTKIWMGTTQLQDLSAGWIPSTQLTLVFDGTVNYPAGENTIIIPLQTLFNYSGGNLVVMFNRPMDAVYYSSSDLFKGQTIGTNRARNVYNDSTVYDPANPGAVGTVTGQFAKTTFHMTPLGPDPIFNVNPSSKNFGTVLIDTTQNQIFTVMNVGGGTLTVSTITIDGSPFFSLQNLPTLPVSLTTGQSTTFLGRYNPTAAGTHNATVTITDNRGNRYEYTLKTRDSRDRLPHTVALSGTCIDTTVNSLPYTQNFDGVTAPALPVDWSYLISPGGSSPAVVTIASSPHSTPNCVRIYNGSPAAPNTMLIAPPLSTTIPVNTTRLKLWVKGVGATYTLSVGVMSDPLDATTYTEIQNFATPTVWTEFIIPFNGYTGTNRYIAIKHGNTAAGQTIYVDDATIELIAANDLACTALSGNTTPSVNVATTYTASVFNWGTNAQSTYTVKLFDSNNVELATAPGVNCAPGVTVQVPLVWTPTVAGPAVIYAKVILTGDQNSANDQSPNLSIAVQPAGVMAVTIGDGSQTARLPMDFFYRNSLYECLFFPDEMGFVSGTITSLSFYNNFSTNLPNGATKIWLGSTNLQDLSANWIPSTQLTLVFDGTVQYPSGANTITIPLQTPYMHTPGNLVLMVNRPMDTQYYSSLDYFLAQTVGTTRARNMYSDSTTYDPANPTGGTVSGQFPKITLFYTGQQIVNDMGCLSITGNTTPSVGASSDYVVTIKNNGTAVQNTYQVKLMQQGGTELASVNGPSINSLQTLQVTIPWTPTVAGAATIYGMVVLTGDEIATNNQSPNLNIVVNPSGVFALTIGDGSQSARMPMDFYWKNSLFETLYFPAEMGNFLGMITSVQFYNNFVTNNPNGATKIWIGTTTQTDLSAGWIPSTNLTLVFDGTVTYPSGQNIITIPFNQQYLYLNGENLVLLVNRPMDTVYYSSSDNFQAQTVGTNRSRNVYSDSTTYDPADPGAVGTVSGQFPKTTFFGIPGGVGHVQGTVLGIGNQPLEGVAVQIQNTTYATTTNAQGFFQIQNVLPDDYTISFSHYGYNTLTQNFTLEEDETEIINVTMTPMATVSVTGTIIASDTQTGLSGASIHLTGYADYTANSIATGAFTFPAVYASQTYNYSIICPGYTSATGTINVGTSSYNMGTITLNEVAYAPHSVVAAANGTNTEVTLTWQAPDANAIEVTESFEMDVFPPQNWTQVITNTGGPNTNGVYPTWCRFGAITISGQPATPTDGTSQAGLWWAYTHQDEWLITPTFNCPPGAYLRFDSYVFLGSTNADHYNVNISADNGTTWITLWDASAQTGGWNYYASPITVPLDTYGGMQVKLAFQATDGPNDDGLWYVWFIDDIYIGNAATSIHFDSGDLVFHSAAGNHSGAWNVQIPDNPSRSMALGGQGREPRLPSSSEIRHRPVSTRVLTGYKVWRLTTGQEGNESAWTLLTPEIIVPTTLVDQGWQGLPNGTYRWAVKAVYTNGVASVPSFSNALVKELVTGMIAGVVRRTNNVPIVGATVTAAGVSATTNNAGAYSMVVEVGTHDVTCTATGFVPQTVSGIVVTQNQTTTVNFVMIGVANEDEVIPVTATELLANYPNPFNPETTVSYSLKDAAPVRIEIFNAKGQRVRVLVSETQASGWYKLVWNGKDDNGRAVSSGVYLCRMQAGDYRGSRKMILLQ